MVTTLLTEDPDTLQGENLFNAKNTTFCFGSNLQDGHFFANEVTTHSELIGAVVLEHLGEKPPFPPHSTLSDDALSEMITGFFITAPEDPLNLSEVDEVDIINIILNEEIEHEIDTREPFTGSISGRYFINQHTISFWGVDGDTLLKSRKPLNRFLNDAGINTTDLKLEIANGETMSRDGDIIEYKDAFTGGKNNGKLSDEQRRRLMAVQHNDPNAGKEARMGNKWAEAGRSNFKKKDPLKYNNQSRMSESFDSVFDAITESIK